LNFLRMSFVYLALCTKVPSFAYLIWSPRKHCNSPIMDILNSLLISSRLCHTLINVANDFRGRTVNLNAPRCLSPRDNLPLQHHPPRPQRSSCQLRHHLHTQRQTNCVVVSRRR
jgi:hypothetical protein